LNASWPGEMSATTTVAPRSASSIVKRPGPAPTSSTPVAAAHVPAQVLEVDVEAGRGRRRVAEARPLPVGELVEELGRALRVVLHPASAA
jgi:hypothetical protein